MFANEDIYKEGILRSLILLRVIMPFDHYHKITVKALPSLHGSRGCTRAQTRTKPFLNVVKSEPRLTSRV